MITILVMVTLVMEGALMGAALDRNAAAPPPAVLVNIRSSAPQWR